MKLCTFTIDLSLTLFFSGVYVCLFIVRVPFRVWWIVVIQYLIVMN
jgi:hypothetical protein